MALLSAISRNVNFFVFFGCLPVVVLVPCLSVFDV